MNISEMVEFIQEHWIHFVFRRVQSVRIMTFLPNAVYTGLTNNQVIRSNDMYQGHHIFFNFITCSQTNMLTQETKPYIPQRGDFICGIVCKYKNRCYYKIWFQCNYEFIFFWTLIFNQNHPCLFTGCHRKSNAELLSIVPHYQYIAQYFLQPSIPYTIPLSKRRYKRKKHPKAALPRTKETAVLSRVNAPAAPLLDDPRAKDTAVSLQTKRCFL